MTALRDDFQDSDPTAVDHPAHHNALAARVNELADVDGTPDADKPVSTPQQAAIDAASTTDRARASHTGTQLAATVSDFAAAADARITAQKGVALGLVPLDVDGHIAWIYLPADAVVSVAGRTGVVVLVKADVGLGSVDNTSDANKPVSTAQQTALDLKAPLAGPTFTGTVAGITKAMVGLGSVDNTADMAKPVSTAQAAADALKANAAAPALTGTITIGADTNLYRSAADVLKTDDALTITGVLTSIASAILAQTGGQLSIGNGSANADAALNVQAGSSGNPSIVWSRGGTNLWIDYLSGTSTRYLRDMPNAKMHVTYIPGAGAGGGSTIFNSSASVVGTLNMGAYSAGTSIVLTTYVNPDPQYRFTVDANGLHLWGGGSLAGDTTLYRSATATLKTDGALIVTGVLTAPTAAPGTNTTQVATTAYVIAAAPPDLLTTGEETLSRLVARDTTLALTSGKLLLSYFTARKTETVTQVRINSGSTAAGATPTTVLIGVYSVAGNGDLTLVASTANDTSLLAATGTAYTKALQASFAKVAGTRYALGVLVVTAAAAPTVPGMFVATAAEAAVAPRLAGSLTGQTGLPTPITAASVVNTSNVMYGVVLP